MRRIALIGGLICGGGGIAAALVVLALAVSHAEERAQTAEQQLAQYEPLVEQAYEEMQEHVLNPPDDGRRYATMIFTSENWRDRPRERELVAWFDTNRELRSLKSTTHFHHYTTASRMYHTRFKPRVGSNFPIVCFQDYQGVAHYVADRDGVRGFKLPASSRALVEEMAIAADLVRQTRPSQELPGQCGPWRPDPWDESRPDDNDNDGGLFPNVFRRVVQRRAAGLFNFDGTLIAAGVCAAVAGGFFLFAVTVGLIVLAVRRR